MDETWKSPKNILALIALVISFVVNIYQYFSSERQLDFEKAIWQNEYSLEKEKWSLEREKLEIDIKKLKELAIDRGELKSELNSINNQINNWDKDILFYKLKLTTLNNELNTTANKFRKETIIKNIKLYEEGIKTSNDERNNLVKRRQEIESILNGN
ncbi:MAG TPA: hypothetical protein PLX35_14925 [Cyclobacteriaceae bacterium]|nr:hypothetical protein [Cyclobacteriaceae bacterium]